MEDFANQSEMEVQDTASEQVEASEHTQTEGQDSPPQEEPRGIKVKYNKEERFVPEDEVPDWVQKGLNYDKVSEKAQQAERYQQNLDRIAKFYGFDTHDEYMDALEREEQNRIIKETADRYGVDEEFLRSEFNPIKQELDQTKSELQQLREAEMIRQVSAQLESMERNTADYPDFSKYKNAVIDIAANRGYALEDAYIIASYKDRINSVKSEVQRETLRNLQQNADSSTGALGADSPDQVSGYLAMSPAERKAFRDSVRGRAN